MKLCGFSTVYCDRLGGTGKRGTEESGCHHQRGLTSRLRLCVMTSGRLAHSTDLGVKVGGASLIQVSHLRLGVNCYVLTRRNGHRRTQRL